MSLLLIFLSHNRRCSSSSSFSCRCGLSMLGMVTNKVFMAVLEVQLEVGMVWVVVDPHSVVLDRDPTKDVDWPSDIPPSFVVRV
jgi:hypothetical protein